jgi:hypothetical protein
MPASRRRFGARRWAIALAGAAVGVSAHAGVVRAQAANKPCDLVFTNTDTTRVTAAKLASGKYNTFTGAGVRAHCRNDPGVTLKSDSAEYYDEQGLLYLIGRVHYTDPRAVVDAHHMTYYVANERLLADTDVVAVLPSGTTMHGPHADYLRSIPAVRPRAQLTATGRPHFHLVQQDSTTSTPDTAGVDANTVYMNGDSLIYASRRVVIKRTDLIATSDSAFMNQGTGFARLTVHPIINGTQTQHPFTLRGDIVDIYTVNHELARVEAIRHGDAVSKDMHLVADTIDLRFDQKVLARSYSWGPTRARATTPERDILADSIDVLMPGQVIHQIRAVRKAYATGEPDTTHFKSKERDWMKGDTIIAYFDTTRVKAPKPAPPRDVAAAPPRAAKAHATPPPAPTSSPPSTTASAPASDSQPQVKTIVANGDAHALYQLPPRDKTLGRPAINYVIGRVITVAFVDRQVETVRVTDSAVGVYLEPQSDTVAKDSLKRAKALADTMPKKKGKKGTDNPPPVAHLPAAAVTAGPPAPGPEIPLPVPTNADSAAADNNPARAGRRANTGGPPPSGGGR